MQSTISPEADVDQLTRAFTACPVHVLEQEGFAMSRLPRMSAIEGLSVLSISRLNFPVVRLSLSKEGAPPAPPSRSATHVVGRDKLLK